VDNYGKKIIGTKKKGKSKDSSRKEFGRKHREYMRKYGKKN